MIMKPLTLILKVYLEAIHKPGRRRL